MISKILVGIACVFVASLYVYAIYIALGLVFGFVTGGYESLPPYYQWWC